MMSFFSSSASTVHSKNGVQSEDDASLDPKETNPEYNDANLDPEINAQISNDAVSVCEEEVGVKDQYPEKLSVRHFMIALPLKVQVFLKIFFFNFK